jgi:hypothetical protein
LTVERKATKDWRFHVLNCLNLVKFEWVGGGGDVWGLLASEEIASRAIANAVGGE